MRSRSCSESARLEKMETMPFKRSRTYEPSEPEKDDDEVAPEVPTSFATKGVGWSGREKEELKVVDLNERKKK